MNLMLGTSNPGKLREFRSLLEGLGLDLYVPADESLDLDITENGESYRENAIIKARAFSRSANMWALADDTGLEVDAIGGAPGLRSARYVSAPDASDADRREQLLAELEGHPTPWTARFQCVAALADPEGVVFTAKGVCAGQIVPEEKGSHGFGYDSIFLVLSKGQTMAQLPLDVKNQVSHRAQAVKNLEPHLRDLIAEEKK